MVQDHSTCSGIPCLERPYFEPVGYREGIYRAGRSGRGSPPPGARVLQLADHKGLSAVLELLRELAMVIHPEPPWLAKRVDVIRITLAHPQ